MFSVIFKQALNNNEKILSGGIKSIPLQQRQLWRLIGASICPPPLTMKSQALTKKQSLDYGFVRDSVGGRPNSRFSLVCMPCSSVRFVNRSDKEINVSPSLFTVQVKFRILFLT